MIQKKILDLSEIIRRQTNIFIVFWIEKNLSREFSLN